MKKLMIIVAVLLTVPIALSISRLLKNSKF